MWGLMDVAKSSGTSQIEAEDRRTTVGGRPLPARSGRRPGDSGTRAKILTAALELFATKGYAGATIRAIADRAQVDPALIHHFFTNKEGVYQAAIDSRLSASSIFDDLAGTSMPHGDVLGQGKQFARAYLSFWEAPATRLAMIAIYRVALTDTTTSEVYRIRVTASNDHIARHLGLPETDEVDAMMAVGSAHLIGIAALRYVAKVEPLASMDFDDLITWVAPALDAIFARRDPDA
ncbi:TetR/AcrR family transcriptional regulator [Streptomyces sp. NPDC089919]|uniref:TetR/AcrR family transcriptional regulator n=1 Tax=Streptomyces sp. NPDC089919 TaxID=3155188 RepID=UPI0034431665